MKKIIILVGEGDLPKIIIKFFLNKGIDFFCLGFENNRLHNEIKKSNHKIINLGKVVTELKKLKSNGYNQIIMAGAISRPNLKEIKPDFNSIKLIPSFTKRLMQGGDNNLLLFAINSLEKIGFKILSINRILPELFIGKGNYTRNNISNIAKNDILKAKKILDNNSKFDIGQSLVIQQGSVIAIEAAEGTDGLIKRSSMYFKKGEKPILVKLAKIKQDQRADLPTIGMKTIRNCKKKEIGGIAFSANKTIFINKNEIIKYSNINKLFLFGI